MSKGIFGVLVVKYLFKYICKLTTARDHSCIRKFWKKK